MAGKANTGIAALVENANTPATPTPQPVVDQTPGTRRPTAKQRASAVVKAGARILKYRTDVTRATIALAKELVTVQNLFLDDEGKPGTLTFTMTGLKGEAIESELNFFDWTSAQCRLNRSSTGLYLQAGKYLLAHPEAEPKVDSYTAAVELARADSRDSAKTAKAVEALPEGSSIEAVSAAIKA